MVSKTDGERSTGTFEHLREFANLLDYRLSLAGISSAEFQRRYGVSDSTLSKWRQRKAVPSDRRVLERLVVGLNELCPEEDELTVEYLYELANPDKPRGNVYDETFIPHPGLVLELFECLTYQERKQIEPRIIAIVARDMAVTLPPKEQILQELLEEALWFVPESKDPDRPSSSRKKQSIEKFASDNEISAKILNAINAGKSLETFDIAEIRRLAQVLPDRNGERGNLEEFLYLSGWDVGLKQMVARYMQQRGFSSAEDLVDHLCQVGEWTPPTAKRNAAIAAMQHLIQTGEPPSNRSQAAWQVFGYLSSEFGFPSPEAFIKFAQGARNGAG